MSCYVVDASVAAKWFLPEEHAEAASRVRRETNELHIPDLFFPELANILWKRQRAGEITQEEAAAVLEEAGATDMKVHPSWPLVLVASEIAAKADRAVYDSMYIALAVDLSCEFVTADLRLFNAVRDTSLGRYVVWVGDIPGE